MIRILAINPGSTSTKVAVFEDEQCVITKTVNHSSGDLARYKSLNDQLPYRIECIFTVLEQAGISMDDIDVFVGRGGGMLPVHSGTYEINECMVAHAYNAVSGVQHASNLGVQIAYGFQTEYGGQAFVVNPVTVDEYQQLARITGLKGVYRKSVLHALNLKETAIRHASSIGRRYEDCNFIGCNIGGGFSVAAHKKGRMVDAFNGTDGEGAMAATRCGGISVTDLLDYMEQSQATPDEVRELCIKSGGLLHHLGTSNAIEVERRIADGDRQAALVWDAMIYQIGKCIGSMAVVLGGEVDGILLSGGIVHSRDLVGKITESCAWIAPVTAYPGEFEMEAMAAGALRVINGEEQLREYTGRPAWDNQY